MFFPLILIILLFTCLGVIAVRATEEEPIKDLMLELNMSLGKYVILLEARWIISEIHTVSIAEHLIDNRDH